MLALVAVLLAHAGAEQLFEAVQRLSEPGYGGLDRGLTWPVVMIGVMAGFCAWLRGGFYDRNAGLGRLSVLGLFATHYLGLSILHWRSSIAQVTAIILTMAGLGYLAWRFRHAAPQVFEKPPGAGVRYLPRGSEPEPRPGLILFLSFLSRPGFWGPTHAIEGDQVKETSGWTEYKEAVRALCVRVKASSHYRIGDSEMLADLGKLNIRMPLESIRVQLSLLRLTDIAVIPSCDAPQRVAEAPGHVAQRTVPYSGSHAQVPFFEEVCGEIFGPLVPGMPTLHVVDGADFEREVQISRSVRLARETLIGRGATPHYLDVTGGQAVCSIVGAAQSLREDDRCVYISTRDYQAISYDFVAEAAPELG